MTNLRNGTAALLLMAALPACDGGTGPDAGPPASMDVVSGDLQTATVGTELPQPLVVRVEDAAGRPVRNEVVNFRVVAGNGQVFAGAARTNNQGEARERWTLGTVAGDTQRVEVRAVDSSTGEALVLGSFRAIGTPDAPAAISAVPPAQRTGTAGRPLADSLGAKVTDRYGNGVPGVAVAWSTGANSGSVSPATAATGPGGIAKAQWTLGPALTVPQTARAAAAGGSVEFVATAAAPYARMLAVAGDRQSGTFGFPLADSVAVMMQDAAGAPVAGVAVTWQAFAGHGFASPAVSVSGPDGIARAQWTLGSGGDVQLLRASVPFSATENIGFTFAAQAFAPTPPRVSTDSVKRTGSTATGFATVWPEGKAGTSWFERGLQPDLSDAQVVGSQAFAAGTDPIHRSIALTPGPGQTVYFRIAASNAHGTARGQILSFRAVSDQTNFRARFDEASMSVILEWDDVGTWVMKFYGYTEHGWYDIHEREPAAPEEWIPGDRRQTEDVRFDVRRTSVGPYYMLRCPQPVSDKSGCTRFDAPAVTAVPLAAPTGLQAAVVAGGVRLTWQDNATNELDYVIVRTSPEGTFQRRIIAEQNATSYTDTEAPAGATYRYRVYARARWRYTYGLTSDWENRLSAPAEVTVTR